MVMVGSYPGFMNELSGRSTKIMFIPPWMTTTRMNRLTFEWSETSGWRSVVVGETGVSVITIRTAAAIK